LQEADEDTRARLAVRLGDLDDLPLGTVNGFFHCAPSAVRKIILQRNESAAGTSRPIVVRDPLKLLAAAREENNTSFALQFSQAMHIPPHSTAEIFSDISGQSLAVLCKGVKLGRGFFSALALLVFKNEPIDPARLTAFEEISQRAADSITAFWQTQNRQTSRAA